MYVAPENRDLKVSNRLYLRMLHIYNAYVNAKLAILIITRGKVGRMIKADQIVADDNRHECEWRANEK